MATLIDPRAIQEELAKTSDAGVAQQLQALLGQKNAAYLAGLKDPKMVGRWIKAGKVPSDSAVRRLRTAWHVTRLLSDSYDIETAKAWLWGSNSRLAYDAPAYVIRHARDADDLQPLVPAAIAFISDAG